MSWLFGSLRLWHHDHSCEMRFGDVAGDVSRKAVLFSCFVVFKPNSGLPVALFTHTGRLEGSTSVSVVDAIWCCAGVTCGVL